MQLTKQDGCGVSGQHTRVPQSTTKSRPRPANMSIMMAPSGISSSPSASTCTLVLSSGRSRFASTACRPHLTHNFYPCSALTLRTSTHSFAWPTCPNTRATLVILQHTCTHQHVWPLAYMAFTPIHVGMKCCSRVCSGADHTVGGQ